MNARAPNLGLSHTVGGVPADASLQVAIGEEFLYCVKAAGFAAAGAASGRAGGLRPVPPSAPPSPCQRPQYGREVSSPSSPMATCPCG